MKQDLIKKSVVLNPMPRFLAEILRIDLLDPHYADEGIIRDHLSCPVIRMSRKSVPLIREISDVVVTTRVLRLRDAFPGCEVMLGTSLSILCYKRMEGRTVMTVDEADLFLRHMSAQECFVRLQSTLMVRNDGKTRSYAGLYESTILTRRIREWERPHIVETHAESGRSDTLDLLLACEQGTNSDMLYLRKQQVGSCFSQISSALSGIDTECRVI